MFGRSSATQFRITALILAVGALALTAPRAQAAQSFDSFCAEWMQKLAQREQANAAKVEYRPQGSEVVGTYVGYDKTPT